MNSVNIAKIRREIARLVKTEEEAQYVVQILLETNWQEVYINDAVPCIMCNMPVQHYDIHRDSRPLADKRGPYCPECYKIPVEKKCYDCGKSYTMHRDGSAWCEECRTFPCAICSKSYKWSYKNVYKICENCKVQHSINEKWDKEYHKLSAHVHRTGETGKPDVLRIEEWFRTLIDFDWRCSYCLINLYDNLDHFVPVCKSGRTVVSNCVPACKACNTLKGNTHPDNITSIPQESILRVSLYLQTR